MGLHSIILPATSLASVKLRSPYLINSSIKSVWASRPIYTIFSHVCYQSGAILSVTLISHIQGSIPIPRKTLMILQLHRIKPQIRQQNITLLITVLTLYKMCIIFINYCQFCLIPQMQCRSLLIFFDDLRIKIISSTILMILDGRTCGNLENVEEWHSNAHLTRNCNLLFIFCGLVLAPI